MVRDAEEADAARRMTDDRVSTLESQLRDARQVHDQATERAATAEEALSQPNNAAEAEAVAAQHAGNAEQAARSQAEQAAGEITTLLERIQALDADYQQARLDLSEQQTRLVDTEAELERQQTSIAEQASAGRC